MASRPALSNTTRCHACGATSRRFVLDRSLLGTHAADVPGPAPKCRSVPGEVARRTRPRRDGSTDQVVVQRTSSCHRTRSARPARRHHRRTWWSRVRNRPSRVLRTQPHAPSNALRSVLVELLARCDYSANGSVTSMYVSRESVLRHDVCYTRRSPSPVRIARPDRTSFGRPAAQAADSAPLRQRPAAPPQRPSGRPGATQLRQPPKPGPERPACPLRPQEPGARLLAPLPLPRSTSR